MSSSLAPDAAKVGGLPEIRALVTCRLGYAGRQGLEHRHCPGVDVYVINVDLVVQVQF